MEKQQIFTIIQDSFKGLETSGVLDNHIDVVKDTVLIGPDAVLDSIAFVTLFVDLEEALGGETGQEIYLLVDEIHEFNPEDTYLTVQVLVDYIYDMLNKA